MTRKASDITGLRSGRLIALYPGEMKGRERQWVCRCDCGATARVKKSKLTAQTTRSCGCLKSESTSARFLKHGHSLTAKTVTPTYRIWEGMLHRCKHHPDYAGRGISLDPAWRDFRVFLADMGERPSPKLSLDRIDNDGNYTKANCRWATRSEQNANQRKRRPRTAHHNGAKLSDEQVVRIFYSHATHRRLADEYGVDPRAIGAVKSRKTHRHITRDLPDERPDHLL